MRSQAAILLGAALAACSAGVDTPELPTAGPDAHRAPQGTLLLYPEPSPERLLGRAVTRSPDGGVTIEQDLAPGCDVRVHRSPNVVEFDRETELREATNLGAGYAAIASFEAKWGKALTAAVRAKNAEVVRAELSGPCGDEVISEVFVGTGERTIQRSAAVSGQLSAGGLGVTGSAGTDRAARALDSVKWTEPQVYAFNTRQMKGASLLEVDVSLPPRIVAGDRVALTITTSDDAFLLVYYVGADGKGDAIVPSNEDPRPATKKGQPFAIPSPAQIAAGVSFEAQLAEPGKPQRDRLLIYAFRAEGDFKLVRSWLDETGGDAQKIETILTERLQAIPAHRWRRRIVTYDIVPK